MASSTHFLPKLHRAPHLALPPRPGATHACSDGPCMIPKRSRRRATLPTPTSSFPPSGVRVCHSVPAGRSAFRYVWAPLRLITFKAGPMRGPTTQGLTAWSRGVSAVGPCATRGGRPHLSHLPHLSSPVLTCPTCPHLAHLSSPVLTWPHLSSPVPPVLTWPHLASPPFYKSLCPRRTRSCPPRLARKGRQARRSRRCLVAAVSERRLAREDFG